MININIFKAIVIITMTIGYQSLQCGLFRLPASKGGTSRLNMAKKLYYNVNRKLQSFSYFNFSKFNPFERTANRDEAVSLSDISQPLSKEPSLGKRYAQEEMQRGIQERLAEFKKNPEDYLKKLDATSRSTLSNLREEIHRAETVATESKAALDQADKKLADLSAEYTKLFDKKSAIKGFKPNARPILSQEEETRLPENQKDWLNNVLYKENEIHYAQGKQAEIEKLYSKASSAARFFKTEFNRELHAAELNKKELPKLPEL